MKVVVCVILAVLFVIYYIICYMKTKHCLQFNVQIFLYVSTHSGSLVGSKSGDCAYIRLSSFKLWREAIEVAERKIYHVFFIPSTHLENVIGH